MKEPPSKRFAGMPKRVTLRNNITEGFIFDGFDNEELYEILMEFVGDASKAFLDRIDADANESNLHIASISH
ncbi:MAG: hypothetical protein U5K37_11670 [Natrialbaceae archaeon]|nr:hypothetical protein [Natrialbaceae archaeon]